jgi:hypothetical protein
VVVAVIAMRMVQVAVHHVIRMVAMRHRFMAAAGAVLVRAGMPAAIVFGGAGRRVGGVHLQPVFLHAGAALVVQVAVVQVINVAVMLDAGMPTTRSVLVGVTGVSGWSGRHGSTSFLSQFVLGADAWSRRRFEFVGVRQRVSNQAGNVPVCQCVVQVRADPGPHHQPPSSKGILRKHPLDAKIFLYNIVLRIAISYLPEKVFAAGNFRP